jgi:hypothetical protein
VFVVGVVMSRRGFVEIMVGFEFTWQLMSKVDNKTQRL